MEEGEKGGEGGEEMKRHFCSKCRRFHAKKDTTQCWWSHLSCLLATYTSLASFPGSPLAPYGKGYPGNEAKTAPLGICIYGIIFNSSGVLLNSVVCEHTVQLPYTPFILDNQTAEACSWFAYTPGSSCKLMLKNMQIMSTCWPPYAGTLWLKLYNTICMGFCPLKTYRQKFSQTTCSAVLARSGCPNDLC